MTKYLIYIVTSGFVLGLMACSSMQTNLPDYDELFKAQTKQNGRACIRESDIDGYGVLEDNVVSMSGRRPNEYFLLTTLYHCQALTTSFQAAFVGGFSELCGGGRDKIFTGGDSCPIQSIFKFDSREHAFAAFDKATETRNQLRKEFEQQKANKSE